MIHQRWPLLLNAVLLFLFCWLLAQWTWLMLLPNPSVRSASPAPFSAPLAADAIMDSHLFGQAVGEGTATSVSAQIFSNLKLQGVLAATGTLPAFAIVVVDGKQAQPVQVGKEVSSGIVLEEVYPHYVLLRRNGAMERLNLVKGAPVLATAGPTEFKLNVQQRGGDSFSFSRKELDMALQDSKQLANLGRMSPYAGGGMLVDGSPPGSLASKMGLQVGDVVKSFNGYPVKSSEDMQNLLQQLRQLHLAQLQVMRGGATIQLQYQISP